VGKVRFRTFKFFKWVLGLYILLTALIGTLLILTVGFGLKYHNIVPQSISVSFENGFTYATNPKDGRRDKVLIDESGQLVVDGSIRSLMIDGKIIYGYRDPVLSDEQLYFICTYGEDCSKSQNYNDIEFKFLLEKQGLPPFRGEGVRTRRDLIVKEWLIRLVTLQWQWG
jgi:hypothetical protein